MSDKLEFTGERFTPECPREIWYEHMHRYALAARLCAGRRVLDAACGEGYGSALLATSAAQVTGLDVSEAAIEHARQRYGDREQLEFVAGDCTRLPFADGEFDCVVSFETLEHLENQAGMLAEFSRVLGADGFLVLSSPDRAVYSDQAGNHNEFHVRELYRDELEALLTEYFRHHVLLGQKLVFQSAIWRLDPAPGVTLQQWQENELRDLPAMRHAPMYFIALAAQVPDALPDLGAGLWLFDDNLESVYAHYQAEIRRNMAAGGLLAERDREIEMLRARLATEQAGASGGWFRRLLGRG